MRTSPFGVTVVKQMITSAARVARSLEADTRPGTKIARWPVDVFPNGEGRRGHTEPGEHHAVSDAQARHSPTGVRFLTDADGAEWTIWEVKPRLQSASVPLITSLPPLADELRDGWLTFQSETERRRVAPAPTGWSAMSDAALLQILRDASSPLPDQDRVIE
jgi:hypothetical protein